MYHEYLSEVTYKYSFFPPPLQEFCNSYTSACHLKKKYNRLGFIETDMAKGLINLVYEVCVFSKKI